MIAFLSWYFLITLLGWLSFPLVFRLLPALADRGYTLARTAGLLVWGFAFWWLASMGFIQNDVGGLLLGLFILAGLSIWALNGHLTEFWSWVKQNWRVILTTELLFLAAFAFLAYVRAANPEIIGTEKPMELAFIDAILRSPTFPPSDPWLSGYAISYYYFGYVLTAMLARLTAVPGTAAFNLMLALVFGLGAVGSYGILYNLLAAFDRGTSSIVRRLPSVLSPLLAPLFLLLVSNVEGFLEILHDRGWFWTFNADGSATSSFWTWLDIKDLTQAPALGAPQRFWWWWRASRVVQDYDLRHSFQEVIDEFPAFSFVLGDLHPHVLAIPFGLLAVAVALNLFLGGWRGSLNLFGARLRISPLGFFSAAFVLGGLAFLNVWDILFASALIVFSYLLVRVREDGWGWARFEDMLLLGFPLIVSAILLYLPFFVGFSSQAGGLLPNLVSPTRGAHLWVMFGTLFLPIFLYLLHLNSKKENGNWRTALYLALGLPLFLWALAWLLGVAVMALRPDVAQPYLLSQGVTDTLSFFGASNARRLLYLGGLITLVVLLIPALAFFFGAKAEESQADGESSVPQLTPFIALLIALGAVLVMGPEFLFLRDQFSSRMNTVFKFYYEAWMLWSLAAAFGTAVLFKTLRGVKSAAFVIFFALLLAVSLAYPVMAFTTKTSNFAPPFGFTLDDFDRVRRENPDEAAAIQWLNGANDGVVAEASIVGASYTGYSRISTYTGLPTVLGWPMHEFQWRGTWDPQGGRQEDLSTLYTTSDWDTARAIIEKYNIRYIVIGQLERSTYPVQEQKFYAALPIVFQQGSITIYEAP